MIDDELRALIPTSKHDVERARHAVARGYPAVAPIVRELLEVLQDPNRPVAKVLAPFLASIGAPLVPEIRRVLETDDHIWKYWLLTCLVTTPDVASALRSELTRLAEHPTPAEATEELDLVARQILDRHSL